MIDDGSPTACFAIVHPGEILGRDFPLDLRYLALAAAAPYPSPVRDVVTGHR